MAFFQLIMNARKLDKARQSYHDEKLKSIEISKGGKVHYTLGQRIRIKKIMFRIKMKEFWKRCLSCPEDSWFHKQIELLQTDGTFENFILKSMIGFLGGIFLTYIFFMFFVFQLNFTLSSATLLCSFFGIILTIGLAFSYKVRCVVFLLLPQFFSKRGRQALMAYAFILALTGPAKNTLHNIGVLSESLACGQEQLKEAVKTIIDLVKQPFYALHDAIAQVIKTVKIVVKKIKEALLAIKRMVLSILRVIKAVFEWLGSIVNICNKKLGTPFERCQKVFDGAVSDCYAKLGPFFGGICNLAYIVGALCYIVKPLDFICMLVSFISDAIVGAVRKKIKKFAKHMKAMFYVEVNFSHSFHFQTNQSRTLEDVATGIVTEIRSRTDKFLTLFDWMSFATSFFVLFMLLRVIHYRHKWLTNERFDNQYITNDLRQIDLLRAKQDKETVLPLNLRERNKYIPLTSITLIAVEKIHLAKSAVFLSLTTFKLFIHMMVDYSLYWILSTIRYHGRFETKVQQMNSVGMFVSGDGYLAQLYRSILRAFSPSGADIEIDTLPCLPDPLPPDLDRYTQIGSLIILCWIMAIFEPYGLRLRQVVMTYYHPERAQQRAVWLYNHIIRSRGSFIKYARRQLRRKFGMNGDKPIGKITFKERMMAVCPILYKFFPAKQVVCLLCGEPQRDDQLPLVKCPTPGCIGIFCPQCFADLQNLCTICRSPMEYGDMSDMSEERDSSEDDKPIRIHKKEDKVEQPVEVDTEEITEYTTDMDETPDLEEKQKLLHKKEAEQIGADTSDSSSVYSQSYQEETPEEKIPMERRIHARDIEAQKIRDDVTIQIFNEPLICDAGESSGDPTSCFVLRAKRKLRSKIKPTCPPCRPDSSTSWSSTCSEDSDSLSSDSTEEIEEEEVLHIEIEEDAGTKALVGEGGSAILRKKRGRVQRIVDALNRVSFIRRRGTKDGERCSGRDSITQKVIKILQSQDPMSCIPCKPARRKSRSDGEQFAIESSDDRSQKKKGIKRSKSHPQRYCCRDVYSMNWDSHRERGGGNGKIPQLDSLAKNTQYYVIDETVTSTDNDRIKAIHSKENKTKKVTRGVEDYDPLAGLEIFEHDSKKRKEPHKRTTLPEEIPEIIDVNEIVEEQKPMDLERDLEEVVTSSPESSASRDSQRQGEQGEKKLSREIYSEYGRRYRRRKRKCKKCRRKKVAKNHSQNEDKSEQTEQKVDSTTAEPTQTPRPNFRPIIYPIPYCCHQAPIPCPGPGYEIEDWLLPSTTQDNEYELKEKNIIEKSPDKCICGDDPESKSLKIPPPFSTYRNYTIPVLRRFLPMYQKSDLIEELKEHDRMKSWHKKAQPKIKACQEIQTDPVSVPDVLSRFSRDSKIPKGGRALPYQSTEVFQQLVSEYKEVTHPDVEVLKPEPLIFETSDEDSPLIPDDSKELIQIYPKPSTEQSRAVSRFKSRLFSVIKPNNSSQKKHNQQWNDASSSPAASHPTTLDMESTDDEETTR